MRRLQILTIALSFLFAEQNFAEAQIDINRALDLGTEILRRSQPQQQRQQPRYEPDYRKNPQVFDQGNQKQPASPQPAKPSGPDRATVRAVQRDLTELGYRPGPVDGVMGRKTRDAIRAFQRDSGLPADGQVTGRLVGRLAEARETQSLFAGQDGGWGAPAGPSFDCDRARSASEIAICGSGRLAQLDRALADSYSDARRSAGSASGYLTNEQTAWLGRRDDCGSNVSCLEALMSHRIAELGGSIPAPSAVAGGWGGSDGSSGGWGSPTSGSSGTSGGWGGMASGSGGGTGGWGGAGAGSAGASSGWGGTGSGTGGTASGWGGMAAGDGANPGGFGAPGSGSGAFAGGAGSADPAQGFGAAGSGAGVPGEGATPGGVGGTPVGEGGFAEAGGGATVAQGGAAAGTGQGPSDEQVVANTRAYGEPRRLDAIDGRLILVTDPSVPIGSREKAQEIDRAAQKLATAISFDPGSSHLANPDTAIALLNRIDHTAWPQIIRSAVDPVPEAVRQAYTQQTSHGRKPRIETVVASLNQFQKKRLADIARARVSEQMAQEQPKLPLNVRVFCRITVGPYDFGEKAFALNTHSCGKVQSLGIHVTLEDAPGSLPLDEGPAQALFARLGGGSGTSLHALMSYDARLTLDERAAAQGVRRIGLERNGGYRLYPEDQPGAVLMALAPKVIEPSAPLASFFAEGASETDLSPELAAALENSKAYGEASGVETASGRIAMLAVSPPNELNERSQAIDEGLSGMFYRIGIAVAPERLSDDAYALGTLVLLDPEERRGLLTEIAGDVPEALGRQIDGPSRHDQMSDALQRHVIPTDRRRVADALRERIPELVKGAVPARPFLARVFCSIQIGEYNVDAKAFPISRGIDNCLRTRQELTIASEGSINRIPMSGEDAESFYERFGPVRALNVAFDTLVSFESGLDRNGRPAPVYRTSRAGPFLVYPPGSLKTPIMQLTPTTSSAQSGRIVELGDPEQTAALFDSARPILRVPDFKDLFGQRAQAGRGVLQLRMDPGGLLQGESLAGLSRHDSYSDRFAVWLGAPRSQLAVLPGVRIEGAQRVIAVLPAPLDAYRVPRRPELASLGSAVLRLDAALDGVWRGSDGSQTYALVAFRPTSARIVNNQGEPVPGGEYDFSDVPISSFERLEFPPVVWLAGKVADALGQAQPEYFFQKLTESGVEQQDTFARQDIAERLAADAAAYDAGRTEDAFWLRGTINFGAYDLQNKKFPVSGINLEMLGGGEYDQYLARRMQYQAPGADLSIAMPRDEARVWQQGAAGFPQFAMRVRAKLGRVVQQHGQTQLHLTLLEAEVLDRNATVTKAGQESVLYRFEFADEPATETAGAGQDAASPAEADAPPAPPLDILGVGLGDGLDDALGKIAAELDAAGPVRVRRPDDDQARRGGQPIHPWSPFGHALVLGSRDGLNRVTVYHEPPTAGEQVTAISRSRGFPPGLGPEPAALIALLDRKYGPLPQNEQGSGPDAGQVFLIPRERLGSEQQVAQALDAAATAEAQRAERERIYCLQRTQGQSHSLLQTYANMLGQGQADQWRRPWIAEDEGAAAPAGEPFPLEQLFPESNSCDSEVLMIAVIPGRDKLVAELYMVLINPGSLAEIADENRRALIEANPDRPADIEVKL